MKCAKRGYIHLTEKISQQYSFKTRLITNLSYLKIKINNFYKCVENIKSLLSAFNIKIKIPILFYIKNLIVKLYLAA